MNNQIQVQEKVSLFQSDYFFHFLMQRSALFRLRLCCYILGNEELTSTAVVYSDTYGHNLESPKMIMDIVVVDDQDRYYNFEMQNGYVNEAELARFQLYAMRLVERQMEEGKSYGELEKVRQLILYTGSPVKNFEHDYHIAQLYDKEYQVLVEKGLLEFHVLQTQKMEEKDMDGRLEKAQDIQEVFWMFANEENHKKEAKSELAKEVKGWYEEYLKSDDFLTYCNIERDRMVIRSRILEGKQEGIELGKEQGIELGELQAKQQDVIMLIETLYGEVDKEFVYHCTVEQLSRAFSLVKLDYETFKEKLIEK